MFRKSIYFISFPIAMHIAAALELQRRLHPALKHLHDALKQKSQDLDFKF